MILTWSKRQITKLTNAEKIVTKIAFKIANTLHGHDGKYCHTQNLSLIKFYYSGIKIMILPFTHFIKHKHIEVHTELPNDRFVQLIYNAQYFGLSSFYYLALKTIIFTLYWCVNDDNSCSAYRNHNVFLLIMS